MALGVDLPVLVALALMGFAISRSLRGGGARSPLGALLWVLAWPLGLAHAVWRRTR